MSESKQALSRNLSSDMLGAISLGPLSEEIGAELAQRIVITGKRVPMSIRETLIRGQET